MNHTTLLVSSIVVFTLFIRGSVAGLPQTLAGPNSIGSAVEYCGMLHMKAGELISVGIVDLGGFIEVRNEPRFNQGIFPNHNWRGFLSTG